jgi:hypothetical protein
MAIKLLTLESRFEDTVVAATGEDFLKRIRKLSEQVQEIMSLQGLIERQLATASMVFQIDAPDIKNSPKLDKLKTDIVSVGTPALKKNYGILKDLSDTLLLISSLESKLNSGGLAKSKDVNPQKAAAELEKLREQVRRGMAKTLAFIEGLAAKSRPKPLEKFTQLVQNAVSAHLAYETVSLKSYVFEADASLCYSDYLRLQGVTDDKGVYHPDLYFVLTYKTGLRPQVFVAVLSKFEIPSDNVLTREVKGLEQTLAAISILLDLENVDNAIGSLPIAMITDPTALKKEFFSYENFISTIVVGESSLTFNLKASVSDRAVVDKVSSRIFKELQTIVRRTNARLRMQLKKVGKTFALTFHFVTANDAPLVSKDDVSFLQKRFNLDDRSLDKIVQIMNVGV